ncbi:MAG: GNAT family protein [Bacteroidia bacterium]
MKLPEHIKSNVLETERLLLREINPEVMNYLFSSCDENDIKEFLGLQNDEAFQTEKEKFENGLTRHNISFKNFRLINKDSGKIIGECGFHTWYFNHRRAEIGYSIFNEDDKAKGYMSEAIKPIISFGFEQMNLHRVEAFIGPANAASTKLVKRLGFKEEGTLREHYFKNNKMEDSVSFSILKHEFELLKNEIYK